VCMREVLSMMERENLNENERDGTSIVRFCSRPWPGRGLSSDCASPLPVRKRAKGYTSENKAAAPTPLKCPKRAILLFMKASPFARMQPCRQSRDPGQGREAKLTMEVPIPFVFIEVSLSIIDNTSRIHT